MNGPTVAEANGEIRLLSEKMPKDNKKGIEGKSNNGYNNSTPNIKRLVTDRKVDDEPTAMFGLELTKSKEQISRSASGSVDENFQ